MAVYQLLSPDAWGAFLASPDVEMLERALREEDEVTDGAAEDDGFQDDPTEVITEEEQQAGEAQKKTDYENWLKQQRRLSTSVSVDDQKLLKRELELSVKDHVSRSTFWTAAEEAMALRPRLLDGQLAVYAAIHSQYRKLHPGEFPKAAADHDGEATFDHRFESTHMTAGVLTLDTIHELMRESTEIQVLVERVYTMPELKKGSDGRISQASFLQMVVKMHIALVPDITEDEAHDSAMTDWYRLVPRLEQDDATGAEGIGETAPTAPTGQQEIAEEQWLSRDLFHRFFVEVGWAWCDEISGQSVFRFWLRVIRAISCCLEATALKTDLMSTFDQSRRNSSEHFERTFSGGVEIGKIALGRKVVSKILAHLDEDELQKDEHLPLTTGWETDHRIICQTAPDSSFGLPTDLDLANTYWTNERPHLKFSLERGWGSKISRKRDLGFLPPLIRAMYADDPSAPVEVEATVQVDEAETAAAAAAAAVASTSEGVPAAEAEEDDGRHMPAKPNEVLHKKVEYSPEPHLKHDLKEHTESHASQMACRRRFQEAHPRRWHQSGRPEPPHLSSVHSPHVSPAKVGGTQCGASRSDESSGEVLLTKNGGRDSEGQRGNRRRGRGESRGERRGGGREGKSTTKNPRSMVEESSARRLKTQQKQSRRRARAKKETAAAGWWFEKVEYEAHERGLATECERSMDAAIALREKEKMAHHGAHASSPHGSPEAALPPAAIFNSRPDSSSSKRVSTADGQSVMHAPTLFTPHYYRLAGGDYGKECGRTEYAPPTDPSSSLPTLRVVPGSTSPSASLNRARPRSARTPRMFPKDVALSMPVHPNSKKKPRVRTPRAPLPGLSQSSKDSGSWDSPFLRQKKTPVWLRYQQQRQQMPTYR
jgi:hypothetical protein